MDVVVEERFPQNALKYYGQHTNTHTQTQTQTRSASSRLRFARGFLQFEPFTNFSIIVLVNESLSAAERCGDKGHRTTDKLTFHHGGGFNLKTSIFTTTCISRITRTSYNHEKHGSRNAATQPVPAPSERNRSGKPVQYGRCDAWQRHVKRRR